MPPEWHTPRSRFRWEVLLFYFFTCPHPVNESARGSNLGFGQLFLRDFLLERLKGITGFLPPFFLWPHTWKGATFHPVYRYFPVEKSGDPRAGQQNTKTINNKENLINYVNMWPRNQPARRWVAGTSWNGTKVVLFLACFWRESDVLFQGRKDSYGKNNHSPRRERGGGRSMYSPRDEGLHGCPRRKRRVAKADLRYLRRCWKYLQSGI